jgi:hypothetical protein
MESTMGLPTVLNLICAKPSSPPETRAMVIITISAEIISICQAR